MVEISAKGDFNNYTEFSMKKSHGVPKGLSMIKLYSKLDFNSYTEFSI